MVKLLTVLSLLLSLSGCAFNSHGMNGSCANVAVIEGSVPYVGGKVNGNVIMCHTGCFGFGCPKADETAFATVMADYIKQQNDGAKMAVSGPGTIIFTPSTK